MLPAFGQIYIVFLVCVLMIHVVGNIKVNTVNYIHNLNELIHVDKTIVVRIHACDAIDLFSKFIYALAAIGVVYLFDFYVYIDHCISGNGNNIDYILICVHTAKHYGIGVVIVICTYQKEGIKVFFPFFAARLGNTWRVEIQLFTVIFVVRFVHDRGSVYFGGLKDIPYPKSAEGNQHYEYCEQRLAAK